MDKRQLWKMVEDWLDFLGLTHSYIEKDHEGNIIYIQSSGKDWCQGAHYMSSDAYTYSGRQKLEWRAKPEGGGELFKPSTGKTYRRWSNYTAVYVFPTDLTSKNNRMYYVWTGDPPELFFHKEQYDAGKYERTKNHRGFIRSSRYVPDKEAESIGIPQDFLEAARRYFTLVTDHTQFLKDTLERRDKTIEYCITKATERIVSFKEIYYHLFPKLDQRKLKWVKAALEIILDDYSKHREDPGFWIEHYQGYMLEPVPGIMKSNFNMMGVFGNKLSADLFMVKRIKMEGK